MPILTPRSPKSGQSSAEVQVLSLAKVFPNARAKPSSSPSSNAFFTARKTCASCGHPLSSAHFTTSTCMPVAAACIVPLFQGQPFARAHLRVVRFPCCAAIAHVISSHGQPFARAHCKSSNCQMPIAAIEHAFSSHGQPFARAHCSNSRCAPNAADEHVCSSHGQPFARAHRSTARCPPSAAFSHVPSSHGQPFARSHFSTWRCPPSAAFSLVLIPRHVRSGVPCVSCSRVSLAKFLARGTKPVLRADAVLMHTIPRRMSFVGVRQGAPHWNRSILRKVERGLHTL